jgi:hypothetical protein
MIVLVPSRALSAGKPGNESSFDDPHPARARIAAMRAAGSARNVMAEYRE